jgi:hypothetical protein
LIFTALADLAGISPMSHRPVDSLPHLERRARRVDVLDAEHRERIATMALTAADSEPTVPASPAPLTPSGLVGVGTGLSDVR